LLENKKITQNHGVLLESSRASLEIGEAFFCLVLQKVLQSRWTGRNSFKTEVESGVSLRPYNMLTK